MTAKPKVMEKFMEFEELGRVQTLHVPVGSSGQFWLSPVFSCFKRKPNPLGDSSLLDHGVIFVKSKKNDTIETVC